MKKKIQKIQSNQVDIDDDTTTTNYQWTIIQEANKTSYLFIIIIWRLELLILWSKKLSSYKSQVSKSTKR